MIYYCIRDFLEGVKEIKICEDVNFRRIKNLLPLLFKKQNYLNEISITQRKGDEGKSAGHRIALKTFRKRKYANLIIDKEMFYSNLRKNKCKSGHPKMRTPIMLCLKARGIHTTPPGNPYYVYKYPIYINFMVLEVA